MGKCIPQVVLSKETFTQLSLWTLAVNARLRWLAVHRFFPLAYEHFINTSEEYDMPLKVSRVFPRSNLKISITVTLLLLLHCRGYWGLPVQSLFSPVFNPNSFFFFFFFFYGGRAHHMACEILVPQSRIKPVPPALEAHSLNHWTTREVPLTASNSL